MSTARDLIKSSLRLIGVLASGETPSADEQTEALDSLNNMLDSWSAENLHVHKVMREEFTLTPNDGSYSMGASADFNTARASKIIRATIEDQSVTPNLEYSVDIITPEEWADIVNKDYAAIYPTKLYAEGTYPNETINLWPKPTVANKLVLYSLKPLSALSIGDTISYPPGYAEALRYNLALRLAPEYGQVLDQAVVIIAQESLEKLKRANLKPQFLSCDAGTLNETSRYDIYKE